MANINWIPLDSREKLAAIKRHSEDTPCVIFKHSTRCSISALAKNRLDKGWKLPESDVLPYFLDLIAYRDLSNAIALEYGVRHESPQVLVIREGRCVYEASHMGISAEQIEEAVNA
ncbi:bacillithiol system redox-active protein YtxJ [Phaeodactylibacter luteus]|uniref:bacillithiol system redox-active protein YtxJ n=1 Tax=Phaeodactylibacter luteus TaxID=1564516 RepID=UPI001B886EB9|nr:bacillithiol system redox-active protein YtxJ [Phaeodactylibacter luteus]